MRVVVAVDEGVLEVNWMWLPTFLGINSLLKAEIEKELKDKIVGRLMDDRTLDYAHDLVMEFLRTKYAAIQGLTDYLDALKYVSYQ